MKLRLRLDDLRVDAFETGVAGTTARGTVRAREALTEHPCPIWTVQNCPPQTADDTCGMTCGPTCEPPTCHFDTVCGCVEA